MMPIEMQVRDMVASMQKRAGVLALVQQGAGNILVASRPVCWGSP